MEQMIEPRNRDAMLNISDAEFWSKYWPVAGTKEFSAYASGDKCREVREKLRGKLKEMRIDQRFWQTDDDLEVLVNYITGRIVLEPRP